MPDHDADAEKEALIQGYVEGALTPDESARLRELVRQDPLLARVIAQSLRMDGAIREVTSGKEIAPSPSREGISEVTPRRGTRRILSTRRTRRAFGGESLPPQFTVIFAAACVLLVIGLLFSASQPSRVEVAQKKANDELREKRDRLKQEQEKARRQQHAMTQRLREIEEQRRALTTTPTQAVPDPEKRKLDLANLESESKRIERELYEAINRELSAKAATVEIEGSPFESPVVKPQPEEPKEDKKENPTVTTKQIAVAKLDRLAGDVFVVGDGVRTPVTRNQALFARQQIESTTGQASVTFGDKTRVTVATDSVIREVSLDGGKRVVLDRGDLEAVVQKQPAGQPMVFSTPHGEITVLGTTLRIRVAPGPNGSTRLDVIEGKVRFTNLDKKSVVVETGHYAIAVAGVTDIKSQPIPQSKAEELLQSGGKCGFRFGPAGANLPQTFLLDSGLAFDANRGYGWDTPVGVGLTPNISPTPLKASYAHGGSAQTTVTWRMRIPNGTYAVTVCVGGKGAGSAGSADQGPHHISLEGRQVIDRWVTRRGEYYDPTAKIIVTDGELTMVLGGHKSGAVLSDNTDDTVINYLFIQKMK